jgi:hypothetical protein
MPNMRTLLLPLLVVSLNGGLSGAADAPGAQPQTVVVGTGDAKLDVPAVQTAVDLGGRILLQGHFSFEQAPTKSTEAWAFAPQAAMVLVAKEVVITGALDPQGGITSIEGGTWPFAVEAPGFPVAVHGLRFVRPKGGAIRVNATSGLTIADCRVEGTEPIPGAEAKGARVGVAIAISTVPRPPTPTEPGRPERIFGKISVVDNYIDVVGATSDDLTVGILVFSIGKAPGREVNLHISGNQIRNVTERAVNIRQVGGRVEIEHNVIVTGAIVGPGGGVSPDVIHAFGGGSFLIAHNSIQTDWATGAGIRVHAAFAEWPVEGALVVDNEVTMSAPEGSVFGAYSAGIEIRGFARKNVVLHNRIRGRARAALAVVNRAAGVPGNNTLGWNDIEDFQASVAGLFVDTGVTNTLIIGRNGKVQDGGNGTVIVKQKDKEEEK